MGIYNTYYSLSAEFYKCETSRNELCSDRSHLGNLDCSPAAVITFKGVQKLSSLYSYKKFVTITRTDVILSLTIVDNLTIEKLNDIL